MDVGQFLFAAFIRAYALFDYNGDLAVDFLKCRIMMGIIEYWIMNNYGKNI